jgi:hypothetical protein
LNTPVDGIFTVTLISARWRIQRCQSLSRNKRQTNGNPGSATPLSLASKSCPLVCDKEFRILSADGLSAACVNCITSNQIGSVNGSTIIGG